MTTANSSAKDKVKFKKVNAKAKTAKDKKNHRKNTNGSANNNRLVIKMHGGEHSTIADQVERLLIKQDVQFYQRSGELVRPISVKLPAAHGAKTTALHLREVNPVFARDMMSRNIDFLRYDMRTDEWKPAVAPLPIAATMIERKAEWNFRNVIGVISTPTMRPDGSLILAEGHDGITDLLLINPPRMPPIPDKPTRTDAMVALDSLKDLFEEFPYVDNTSRSVALSGALSAVARGAFLNAPMHACSATDAGSGKSYQNDVIAMIAIGDKMPVMSTGANEEETEKRLASAMIAGQSLISMDNVSIPLKGDSLCQLIERPIVKLRILGHSKQVQVDTRGSLVFCTGNQLSLVGDICRRSLNSSLDPKLERPEMRQFRANPIAKVQADRGRYVADCLIIVRAYFVAGRPNLAPKLASFEGWSDTVRSALIWLGEADPVDSMEATRAEDPDRVDLRGMMEAWVNEFRIGEEHRTTIANLVEAAMKMTTNPTTGFNTDPENAELHAACLSACETMNGKRGHIDARYLGLWLRGRKGRVIDGMRIMNNSATKGAGKGSSTLWWIENTVTEGQRKANEQTQQAPEAQAKTTRF
jgi:putative DNA primase/helicase